MKTATISEAKNRLSELLARVRRGETILILDRNQPIARLEPLEDAKWASREHFADLERRGVLRRAKKRSGVNLLKSLPPAPKVQIDLLGALLAEREEGP